jgi:hypothetical protein
MAPTKKAENVLALMHTGDKYRNRLIKIENSSL